MNSPNPPATRLTSVQWLICIIAAIGFAFDTYELLMLPLIVRPALEQLGGLQFGTPDFARWRDYFFFVPAVCGGLFGLLGGYLTDRFGRRRILTWSILLYAFSAFAAGFATSLPVLLFLRTTTFIGVCVEFVAAVAWLAELFTDPAMREKVIGWTQAFSSLGGLLVSTMARWIATASPALPAIHGRHDIWRYLLISGLIPALPLILIRPFLPESPVWQQKKNAGTLRRPSLGELFQPALKQTTLITTILFACALGAAFGAIQQMPQIARDLPDVKALAPPLQAAAIAGAQQWQEIGGLLGRCLLALLVVRIASQRKLLRIFIIPGLLIVPFVFLYPALHSLSLLKWGIFFAGFFTVAQLSFWGNYLPRVYPVHLRGTGESFAANIGGRMIGTSAALLTTQIAATMPGVTPAIQLSYAAAAIGLLVYLIALVASFWLPEPAQQELAE